MGESAVKPLIGRKLGHRDYEKEFSHESCAKSNAAATPTKRMRLINQISCEIESPPLRVTNDVAQRQMKLTSDMDEANRRPEETNTPTMSNETSTNDQPTVFKLGDSKTVMLNVSQLDAHSPASKKFEAAICAICLDEITVEKEARLDSCNHTYCDNCITTWVQT